MTDHSDLIAELQGRAVSYRLGGPSSEHTALLLDQAASALSSQSLSLSEARERGDEYERLYRQTHLDYVSAEYKLESAAAELSEAREEIERLKRIHADLAEDFSALVVENNELDDKLKAAERQRDEALEAAKTMDEAQAAWFSRAWAAEEALKQFVAHYPMGVNPFLDDAFRRARSVLENCKANLADAHSNPPLSDLSSLRKGAEDAVKPLEWREPTRANNGLWIAESIFGTFSVGFDDGWHACIEDGIQWEWEPENDPRSYEGPFAAQEACQRYLETRIRSALVSGSREDGADG